MMRFGLPVLISIFVMLIAHQSQAENGACGEYYCTGKIRYVELRSDGSHYLFMDVDSSESQKLTCTLTDAIYIGIGDSSNKKDIFSAVMAVYMRGSPIIVFTNQSTDPCEIERIFLGKLPD
ncbi:MAG: hypothetical protein P8Y42_08120 [Exilibacterium sp.]